MPSKVMYINLHFL